MHFGFHKKSYGKSSPSIFRLFPVKNARPASKLVRWPKFCISKENLINNFRMRVQKNLTLKKFWKTANTPIPRKERKSDKLQGDAQKNWSYEIIDKPLRSRSNQLQYWGKQLCFFEKILLKIWVFNYYSFCDSGLV